MDTKSLAKSKRAHTQHHKKHHPNQKTKAVASSVGSSSAEKAPAKAVKEKPRQSQGSAALPSNWDRYEDEDDDSMAENQIDGHSSQPSDVVVRKSKGADYAYLISEAKSQNSTKISSEIFPSLDDFVSDFGQGKDSFFTSRGESLLSAIQNDSFFVEDKTPANYQLGNMDKSQETESWEIIHIPDKPPFPLHQQPTVKVYAAVIEPKQANTLVRKLNQIVPLEDLRHVKRVRKQDLDGGCTQLSVILCLASESDSQLYTIPQEVVDLISFHHLETFITKVCRYAPLSKEEWVEQCKIWPTSYHPPTYNISGITGFSEEESHSVCTFMKLAIDLAKCEHQTVNAAIVVDPSTNHVIARACDQVNSCSCSINHDQNHDKMLLNSSANHTVSCLNPWQWSNQKSCGCSCSWHPLRHAAIVAIENSSARDRRLYPFSGHAESDPLKQSLTPPSSKKQKTKSMHVKDDEEELSNGCHLELARPYLCTGYDIYLIWEPCAMCAMALVHQRIKRIFYAFPNASAGALGSVHRLQGEKSLNHHYAVFQVLLPENSLDGGGTCTSLVSQNVDSDKTEKPSNVTQGIGP